MAFVPRLSTTSPTDMYTSPWYMSSGNWFWDNGYYFPPPNGNCTWYAYGRYAEIRNGFANLPLGNAGTWYENATSFRRGDFSQGALPELGAIICFKSASGNYLGHVTVVEQINSDGTIVISNSGYQSGTPSSDTSFWTATVSRNNQYRQNWYTQGGRDYYCQGFIYNDISPTPPTPPIPPTPMPPFTSQPMPFWFYIRRLF